MCTRHRAYSTSYLLNISTGAEFLVRTLWSEHWLRWTFRVLHGCVCCGTLCTHYSGHPMYMNDGHGRDKCTDVQISRWQSNQVTISFMPILSDTCNHDHPSSETTFLKQPKHQPYFTLQSTTWLHRPPGFKEQLMFSLIWSRKTGSTINAKASGHQLALYVGNL